MLEPIKWWRLTPSWWLEAAAQETAEAAFIRLTGTKPLDRPCPHCQYFGGEEHHPCCPVAMHYTAHPDGTVTEAGYGCDVCGAPAGVRCDGGRHG